MHPPPAPGGLAVIIRTFTFYLLVNLFPRELRGLVGSLPIKYHPNKYRPAGMKDRLALCLPESVQPHGPPPLLLPQSPSHPSVCPTPTSSLCEGHRRPLERFQDFLSPCHLWPLRSTWGWHVSPVASLCLLWRLGVG